MSLTKACFLLYLCKYCCNTHNPVYYFCKNFSVHLSHKLSAYIKSQAAARYVFGVHAAPEAVKNVGQVRVGKGTAAVADDYKNTAVLLGKIQRYTLSVAVFYGVFDALSLTAEFLCRETDIAAVFFVLLQFKLPFFLLLNVFAEHIHAPDETPEEVVFGFLYRRDGFSLCGMVCRCLKCPPKV